MVCSAWRVQLVDYSVRVRACSFVTQCCEIGPLLIYNPSNIFWGGEIRDCMCRLLYLAHCFETEVTAVRLHAALASFSSPFYFYTIKRSSNDGKCVMKGMNEATSPDTDGDGKSCSGGDDEGCGEHPVGWSGPGEGSNWCNTCTCMEVCIPLLLHVP